MRIRNTLSLVLAVVVSAIFVVGLFNFDLMLEIWVKVLIGVLLAGAIFAVAKRFIS